MSYTALPDIVAPRGLTSKVNPEVKLPVSMTIRLEDARGQDEERDLENRLFKLHSRERKYTRPVNTKRSRVLPM